MIFIFEIQMDMRHFGRSKFVLRVDVKLRGFYFVIMNDDEKKTQLVIQQVVIR